MSKTQTQTVETAYGSVEVELAECDSCGNQVRADETVEFTIGDREGVACEYCRDEGPMSFPEAYGIDPSPELTAAFALFAPLMAILVFSALSDDKKMDGHSVAAGMFLGGVFWTFIGLLFVSPPLRQSVFGALPF